MTGFADRDDAVPAAPTTSVTYDEAATVAAGRALAPRLSPNAVVLLSGGLGAGKTAFVRGVAEGLGVAAGDVTSPTFTLVHEYRGGRLTLYHVDLYRLRPVEVDDLGIDEMAQAGGVVAIEWPDRLPRPPYGGDSDIIHIRIVPGEGSSRVIHIAAEP